MNTTTYFGKTALPVVGITVTATNGRSTQVYALLDTGSDRTFCSPRLLDDLGIKGKPTKFTISTLNKGKELDAQEVSLTAAPISNGFDGTCCDALHLPEVFAIESFPALTNSVATGSDVSKFSHLRGIPFPEVNSTSVKLLIGQDNPDALVPLESRRGERNQPMQYEHHSAGQSTVRYTREKILGQVSLTLCSSRAVCSRRTLNLR